MAYHKLLRAAKSVRVTGERPLAVNLAQRERSTRRQRARHHGGRVRTQSYTLRLDAPVQRLWQALDAVGRRACHEGRLSERELERLGVSNFGECRDPAGVMGRTVAWEWRLTEVIERDPPPLRENLGLARVIPKEAVVEGGPVLADSAGAHIRGSCVPRF